MFSKNIILHCAKSVSIRSFSGPYFPVFGLNMERYRVSLHIQSECGKIRTRKAPNTDTFNAVLLKPGRIIDDVSPLNIRVIRLSFTVNLPFSYVIMTMRILLSR